jgi:hypothetical protein
MRSIRANQKRCKQGDSNFCHPARFSLQVPDQAARPFVEQGRKGEPGIRQENPQTRSTAMIKLALVGNDCAGRARYLSRKTLPANYMADFTILGFVVDQYPAACSLLTRAGYDLIDLDGGADITVGSRQEIGAIRSLLTSHQIHCEFADVVDTLYQA